MLATVAATFAGLLLLGLPIAAVMVGVTALALRLHTTTPLLIIPQQLFNALDNFVLLAIPFFILAGRIMTEGAMARRLVDVMRALVGTKRGGLTWAEALGAVRRGIWALLLPVIVLGGIYTGAFTPTEAAAVSVVYALFVEAVVYRELTWRGLHRSLVESAVLSGCLLLILAGAMAFVWLLTAEGLPAAVAEWVVERVETPWAFLLWVNLLFLALGSVMDDVSAMLILSPIFAETLRRLGIDPVHYGIVMVLVIEFGFLTPPFGLNLFVAMGLTRKPMGYVARATLPFLALLLLALAIVTYVPAVSLWLPEVFYR
ncbi:TRAP transporter large permease [Deferrisoma palaeochoriense]